MAGVVNRTSKQSAGRCNSLKIAAAVISLILGAVITFQSCTVGSLGAIVAPESKAGPIGLFAGILLMVGGAFAFQLPKVAAIISVICALLAFMESTNDFSDMKIWAVICLGIAAMEFFAARKPKTPATTDL